MSKLTGEGFEIFTTGSPADAREALAALEQAQSYFITDGVLKAVDQPAPLRVVAFHSSGEYAAFRLHQNAFGHFFKGVNRSFIVLTDLLPEHREALLHEYTHAVVRQARLTLPSWLNEGVADLYSSLSVVDGRNVAGLPLAGRLRTIEHEGLVPLTELFSSRALAARPYDAAILYAQSWALTHMLVFHPAYAKNFSKLLSTASKNMDSAASLQRIFGKDLEQMDRDLRLYVARLSEVNGLDAPHADQPVAADIQTVDEAESELILSNLLQEQPWTRNSLHRVTE